MTNERLETDRDSSPDPNEFNRTDAGNALWFAALFADRVRYDHTRKAWMIFGPHHWKCDTTGRIYVLARRALKARHSAAFEADRDDRQQLSKWALQSESTPRIEAMLKQAATEPGIAVAKMVGVPLWNRDPLLLGVKNGTVDLRSGELRSGSRDDMIDRFISVDYDPAAEAPRWERYIQEVTEGDSDLADYLQRGAGYTLTGDVSERVLFLLHGIGRNGKTTYTRTLQQVLGPYSCTTPFSTIERAGKSQIPSDVARLAGLRMVTSAETAPQSTFDEARINALTGGDPITARELYGRWFDYRPQMKFWVSCNHLPDVPESAQGFWDRIRILPFRRRFTEEELDKKLESKFCGEFMGILAWIVRGCLAWQARGLDAPESVLEATREYRSENDLLADFLDECVTDGSGDDFTVLARTLHTAYTRWAERKGIEPLSEAQFGRSLKGRYASKRTRVGRVYLGVRLGIPFEVTGQSATGQLFGVASTRACDG